MAKIFYDHLVHLEEVTAVFHLHNVTPKEKQECMALIDETLHHHILDTILTYLPREHHEEFLKKFHEKPHDPKLLIYLEKHITGNITEVIQKRAQEVKKEILTDIKKAKK